MTVDKQIIGFFKDKLIINEISNFSFERKINFTNMSDEKEPIIENGRSSILIFEVASAKDFLKLEKIVKKKIKPIFLILRSKKLETDLVKNYNYMITPFKFNDFLSQIMKLLNNQEIKENRLKVGHFFLTYSELISIEDQSARIKLTSLESKFLNHLCLNKSGSSKKELLLKVWGYSDKVNTHTIESLVYRLRQKIEHDPNSPKILVQTGKKYLLRD